MCVRVCERNNLKRFRTVPVQLMEYLRHMDCKEQGHDLTPELSLHLLCMLRCCKYTIPLSTRAHTHTHTQKLVVSSVLYAIQPRPAVLWIKG